MASSWFSSKVNLSTIVSQGLEHVTKLKDDVEKQFDEAVSGKGTTKLPLPIVPPSVDVQAAPRLFQESSTSAIVVAAPAPPQFDESPPPSANASVVVDGTESYEHPARQSISPPPSTSSNGDVSIAGALDASTAEREAPPPLSDPREEVPLDDMPSSPPPLLPRAEEHGASSEWDQSLDDLQPDADANAALLAIVQSIPPNIAPNDTSASSAATTEPCETPFDASDEVADTPSESPGAEDFASDSLPQETAAPPSPPPSPPSSLVTSAEVAVPSPSMEMSFLQKELAHVQAELRKSQSVLSERENQLLSSSAAMAKLHEELDALRNSRSTTSQSDASVIYSLQVALADKEMQLTNLLDEGEALSKKQAAFESRLRALRKEKTDVLDENKKLTAALETATAKWETARKHLITAEEDARLHAQVLKSLDATDAKLQATEEALAATAQRLAMAEGDVDQLVAENDALKARTQLAAFEDREAMEATIAELQASVALAEAEASKREDQARVALHAMKQRWQEAVTRMDHMTRSTSDATQPLLRQLQLLQEEQRVQELRRLSFEADMQQRVDVAARDVAAVRAQLAVETSRSVEATNEASALRDQVNELKRAVEVEKATVESLRQQLEDHGRVRQQLEHQVDVLVDEKRHLATRLRSIQEQHDVQTKQLHQQLEQQSHEVSGLRRQLHDATTSAPSPSTYMHATLPPSPAMLPPQTPCQPEPLASPYNHLDRQQSSDSLGDDMSMIEWNQLHQRVRLRESEAALLKTQLQTVEEARKTASDDVVRLATQNAALKAAAADLAATKEALAAMEVKQQVLLELLGEKDEQVEELESEFREFKQMYQNQIDVLTRR